uniref:Piezo-type mechanosensitive ion channel component n=1 Tax=Gadus morhua TaxID=8049 RepID=A0A8C4ZEK7_GADMO
MLIYCACIVFSPPAACLFRFNGLSFVYLIYLLLIPLFAEPTSTTMQGHTGRLLMSLCFTSMSFVLFHIIYQITVNSLLATHSINADFNCSMWEKSIRQIGFESVIGADPMNGIRVFLPDIGMFLTGLAVWLVCRSLVHKRPPEDMAQDNAHFQEEEEKLSLEGNILLEEDHEGEEHEEEEEAKESAKMKVLRFVAGVASKVKEIIGDLITTAGKVVVTILLGLTGAMLPSLTSAVYFFVFLFLCTWWSFCRTIDTLLFSCMCVLMAIFSAGHLVILYLYQFQFFQEAITTDDYYIRLFGISPLIRVDCTHTWKLNKNPDLYWHHFVNPGMLLLLYYTLATLIRLWLQEPTGQMEVGPSVSLAVQPPRTASCSKCLLGALQGPNENSFEFTTTDNGPVGVDLYSTPHYKMDQLPSEMGMEGGKKDGEETETETEGEDREKASAVVTVFRFIMKQSYICALIAMMAWSITYVSWLTFVFLLWSCILWMVRDRRRYAMITSPFMVMYGNLLLVLQYIWSFEVLNKVSGFFLKGNVPFSELWTKMLCLLSFWLLLRQTLMEREEKLSHTEAALSDVVVDQDKAKEEEERRSSEKEEEEGEGGEPDVVQVLGSLIMALLVKYWLYICSGMFFFVSFEGRIVMYKIIYMMMFLSCVALYQVHYEWWRRALKYFWMSVVMYTMLVLILVYTFQFDTSPPFWRSLTGMDDKLEDLGLETFSVPELFSRIFIPASFLLVCILHLHYFHDRFLALTDLQALVAKEESTIYSHAKVNGRVYVIMNRWVPCSLSEASIPIHPSIPIRPIHPEINRPPYPPIPSLLDTPPPSSTAVLPNSDLKNKWHLVVDRLTVLFLKFLEYFHKLQLFIWWLLEIHIIKIVSCYIILVSIKEVSLFNSVFLASWAFALPFTQVRPIASSICTVWTCVIVICKMLYQLKSIDPEFYSSNCTLPAGYELKIMEELTSESVLYKKPVDPANWVGLMKSEPLLEYLRNNLLMLAILAFEVTIYRHQQYFRLRNKLTPPAARIIFHGITRQHLDQGIVNFVKYFVNYFFYKFGLETCLLLVVNVIGQRMDFYAMLHAFALSVVMYRRRRKAIAEIWPKYCCFLACMITFQYFMCVGIPPAACKDYPWRFPNSGTESNVVKWLYVPDFHTKPNPMFLFYDFMLLLCASLQRQVFDDENKAAVRLMAGDNVEICRDLDAATFSVHNPVPDFIHCRSYLDMLKVTMFSYLFWFVLTILFFTGTTRISVFCMGYLVACFYFLLFGGELLLKPIKKILRLWDLLIAYNVFVITMKNILSILACGYIHTLLVKHCWLIQLLSLACTIKEYKSNDINQDHIADQCELPKDEAGIIWDSICFAFLLLQRRVFMSYYFLHVVADIRASQILASRGAELFQATIVKAVRARLDEEHRSMEQLKRQMDRIKMRQQKFKRGKEKMLSMTQESGEGQSLVPPEEEDDGAERTKAKTKKKQWWRPWVDHASMVRSGDYYLFETDSEEEEEEEDKTEEDLPKKSAFQRAIGKFASALLALPKSIIKLPKTVLQYVMKAGKFLYHAWITDPKTALREKAKERRKFWKKYTKGVRSRKSKKESRFQNQNKVDGLFDNVIKRMYNIIKFLLVLCQTTVDSFTKWMNEMCQEHIDISSVLRIERCMLTREVKKGNVPSRDHIHVYYQKAMRLNMSRQSSMDLLSEDDSGSQRVPRRRQGRFPMGSGDSMASRDSISSGYTEATMLSRQSTLDDLDGMPECIPKTSERARPKLRKIYGMDASNSSADSGSSLVSSEATQCITLYSRQGTTDTIEEVEDEHDLGEDGHSEDGEAGSRESSRRQSSRRQGRSALLYTPDTDASKTSDAEVPPSYSKVVSFDRLEVSDDDSDMDRGRMAMTSDSRSEGSTRSDLAQPSMMTELTASELLLSKMFYDEELDQSEKFYDSQPLGLQLGYALYNMLVAHSEMVCYLVIILNHIMSANLATLVIPINIFLWAMLSVPRPSKRFWMTAIVYTEVTICIKYFFQFGFFPFNQMKAEKSKPYHPPNIIGVEKKDGYAHYDLIQLLALFFHRSILKCHGLWDEDDKSEKKEKVRDAAAAPSVRSESRGSVRSLDVDGPVDSVQVQMHHSQQKTFQRRKSSSGGSFISHRSGLSSARSKRGSTASHNSSRHDGSEASVQKSRKQLMAEKLREQLIRGKAMVVKRCMDFYEPIRQFFYNLIHPEYSAVTDVYVLMFLADTVDFIIIVFGFWAFGKHSAADITSSLSEDQVPGPFLVMVLIQFGSMVVDRALYLRKTVMGKVVFQVILVFGIHFWMFFILPGVTEKRFNQNRVAQMWYFVKCIYFGLSAYQIRCGYPTRVLGNFLTKSYNYLNLFLFQGFRLVPFLTELRAVMDWVWTDTSLSLSSWICVEDIYAHIFVLKCWRESEKKFPQPRGQKKKATVKYGLGGMIVALLICIVWFPLLFMSLVKSVAGVVNRPLDVSLTITLAGFQPIFTMSAQQKQLRNITEHEYAAFVRGYTKNDECMQWLETYQYEDLTIAELEGSSNSLWTISPPSRKNLIDMLQHPGEEFTITVSWSIQRGATRWLSRPVIHPDSLVFLCVDKVLCSLHHRILKDFFPRYLRAPTDSISKPVEQLLKDKKKENISLSLERSAQSSGEVREWWVVNQSEPGSIKKKTNMTGLDLYIFSDQVSPPSLGFLAGYGIMGLYASVVLVIGKFVREFFSGISHTIMFEELPNVDRILKLCTDIFLVRETGELDLEEDMYAKLIFLYRSPETMIKWTREKTE